MVDLTSLGIQYYATATDNAENTSTSETKILSLSFDQQNSPEIVSLNSGNGSISNYQIISIPYKLNDPRIQFVFDEYAAPYDGIDWRLFHYDNQSQQLGEFGTDFNEFKQGEGYWINTKRNAQISIGPGQTPSVTAEGAFEVHLKNGWNQIGNPYDFDLVWQSILDYNNDPSNLGSLRIYKNGIFENGNSLRRFTGGFVHWSGEEEFIIKIPATNEKQGGRKSNEHNSARYELLVNLKMTNSQFFNNLGYFGIHQGSNIGKDKYDEVTLPRFGNFIDVNFENPDKYPLTKSILPPNDVVIWNCRIESNFNNSHILSWEIEEEMIADNSLLMVNSNTGEIIDMRKADQIEILTQESNWVLIYGPEYLIESALPESSKIFISDPYPNPFKNSLFFRFNEIGDKYIKLVVNDLLGRKVFESNETVKSGQTVFGWNGIDKDNLPIESGLYLISVEIKSEENLKRIVRKVYKQ